jgi:hypothetical protein
MLKAQDVSDQVRAAWKFVASFLKRDWAIDDYPISFRFQPASESDPSTRLRLYSYVARVINWPGMDGGGSTKLEALEDLRNNFEQRRVKKKRLPRPGTGLPLEFSLQYRVNRHTGLAKDFTRRVLQVESAWISDESSLWDFHGNDSNAALVAKVRELYGVDVSDISSGNLADIFDRIATTPP